VKSPAMFLNTKYFRTVICLLLLCAPFFQASAQVDSLARLHSPRKATILSTVLPGAGQIYNKKYWKAPVIYAGFAGLGYLVKFNNDRYQIYKDAFSARADENPETVDEFENVYSEQDLITLKNYYRRNRDLSIIGIGLIYVLNILDASVDAHLFYFNVSDNISMNIAPAGIPHSRSAGILVSFNF
jgi:hypothetical protein